MLRLEIRMELAGYTARLKPRSYFCLGLDEHVIGLGF